MKKADASIHYERDRLYRDKNKEKIRLLKHNHYLKNKEKYKLRDKIKREQKLDIIKRQNREYYHCTYQERKEIIQARRRERRKLGLWKVPTEKNRDYQRKYLKENLYARLRLNLSKRIYNAVSNQHWKKSQNTLNLCGCSLLELRTYLESKFLEGMNWANYGKNGWHIDHIFPCIAFNLEDELEQKMCFNYKNLQPLWESDNCRKNCFFNKEDLRIYKEKFTKV